MLIGLGLLTVSVLLFLSGCWLWLSGRSRARSERSVQRLQSHRGLLAKRGSRHKLVRQLRQAGVVISRRGVVSFALISSLYLLILLAAFGWVSVVMGIALLVLACVVWLRWRYRRGVDKMVSQTPAFLDRIMRSLKSGRTLSDGLLLAMEHCPKPLHDAWLPVRTNIGLGVPVADAMDDFADLYNKTEFHLLAIGVRVNQRYGGNASDLLSSLITLMRDRDQAARQLRALTGETRISAVVLAVLPVSLAGFVLISNPSYFLGLWETSAGRWMLLTAATLQIIGCAVLWRMLRSI